ncbi:hypothetical protein BC831DRAFT_442416 [Entophlyctis helioformis]|nr:hypothetical protein BC831DRAFT_442416 [Entophlyctis helioformis]
MSATTTPLVTPTAPTHDQLQSPVLAPEAPDAAPSTAARPSILKLITDPLPWQSEYQREFTWKSPTHISAFKDLKSEAVQVSVLPAALVDESVQTSPTHTLSEAVQTADATPQAQSHLPADRASTRRSDRHVAISTEQPASAAPPASKPLSDPISQTPAIPLSKPDSQRPLLLPYGLGNTHPVVPSNNLKTFNIRAPSREVYPYTLDRTERMHAYDVGSSPSPQGGREAVVDRPRIPDPENVLKQYMAARKQVQELQAMYHTEYRDSFIDWGKRASSRGTEAGGEARERKETVTEAWRQEPAGLPSSHIAQPPRKQRPVPSTVFASASPQPPPPPQDYFVDAEPRVHDTSQRAQPPSGDPAFQRPQHTRSDRVSTFPPPTAVPAWQQQQIDTRPPSRTKPHKTQPSTFGRSIFEDLASEPAAGVPDAEAYVYRERRHYPVPKDALQIQEDDALLASVQTGSSWGLAQDTLRRAQSRSVGGTPMPPSMPSDAASRPTVQAAA